MRCVGFGVDFVGWLGGRAVAGVVIARDATDLCCGRAGSEKERADGEGLHGELKVDNGFLELIATNKQEEVISDD